MCRARPFERSSKGKAGSAVLFADGDAFPLPSKALTPIVPDVNLGRLPLVGLERRARQLSRATMRKIRQNLFFAFLDHALGVPSAAGALYTAMIASAAITFSIVSVIVNPVRLRRLAL